MSRARSSPSAADPGGLRSDVICSPLFMWGVGGCRAPDLSCVYIVKGGVMLLQTTLHSWEKESYKAMDLLFVTRRVLMLEKSDANCLWVGISLLLPAASLVGFLYLKNKFLHHQLLQHIRGERWSSESLMRAALLPHETCPKGTVQPRRRKSDDNEPSPC